LIGVYYLTILLLSFNANTIFAEEGNAFSTVCRVGCDFSELQPAIKATRPGGTVFIKAEDIKACGLINKSITILGEIDGTRRPHLKSINCRGKGALIIEAEDVEISNLEISGNNVRDMNGACIRVGPGSKNVALKNIYCHDSQNGILARVIKDGEFLVLDSVFERCGYKGRSHGAYIQTEGDIVFKNTQFLSTKGGGHSLKLSAKSILIEGSVIAALNGFNSRAIDLYGGGVLVIRNSIIQQGPKSDNRDMIGLALEKNRLQKGKHSVLLENNWIIFDQHTDLLYLMSFNRGNLFGGYKLGKIIVRDNILVAMSSINMKNVVFEGNQVFNNRKEAGLVDFDGTLASLPATLSKSILH